MELLWENAKNRKRAKAKPSKKKIVTSGTRDKPVSVSYPGRCLWGGCRVYDDLVIIDDGGPTRTVSCVSCNGEWDESEYDSSVIKEIKTPDARSAVVPSRKPAIQTGEANVLMNAEIQAMLLPLGKTSQLKAEEIMLTVKYFTPDSNWTWYAAEYDPKTGLMYGLVDGHFIESGQWLLSELQTTRAGAFGLPIERDLWWTPDTLANVRDKLQSAGGMLG